LGAALFNSRPICNNTLGLALSGFVPVFTRAWLQKSRTQSI